MLVVIFHAASSLDPTLTSFRVGNAGVDIFFVISGFVMWSATSRRDVTPSTFLRQRLIRLVPLYWVFTLALVGAWAAMPSGAHILTPSAPHVLRSLAFVPALDPLGRVFPYLTQGWTLNYEMFFYLLFAGALTLPAQRRLLPVASVLLALPLLGLLVATPQQIRVMPPLVLLSPLLVEFLLGLVLAAAAESDWRPHAAWCWAALAAGVAALIALPPPPGDDEWTRLIVYGAPAFLIVGGAVGIERSDRGLRPGRFPLLLGAASYSIYLSHPFAIAAAGRLLPKSAGMWPFAGAAVLASVVLGVIVYEMMERPLLKWLRTRALAPSPIPPPTRSWRPCRAFDPSRRRCSHASRWVSPPTICAAPTPASIKAREMSAFPFPGTSATCGAENSRPGPCCG
jgi:exopolysaccharide production protein ExoZ